ncbi:MAG: DUF1731 domain-containing protein, partial [Myxococcota bacterium]
MSWIHISDVVRMLRFAINNEDLSGPLNVTAPQPVRNREFSERLAKVLKVPNLMGAKRFWLKLGLGKMAQETILEGQRVLPEAAVRDGFRFNYPDLTTALEELYVT